MNSSQPVHLLVVILVVLIVCGCGGGQASPPPGYTSDSAALAQSLVPEIDAYRVLVDDELRLTVLGNPDLSGTAKVLPDGTFTAPGVGPVYALGMTLEEITEKTTEALATIVRFPRVSVAVSDYGERRIFVMGEIVIPGDHEYRRGMSTLGAIAQAGGFKDTAKRGSVMVIRRLGPDEVVAFRIDLKDPLKGKHLDQDLPVRPFDIIYVPKSFIASVNVLMDQYFRQLTPPFTLYFEGWQALHLDESKVQFITR